MTTMATAGEALLTPAEYARQRQLSKHQVYRYLKSGMIPAAQQLAAGYAWRIPADAEVVVPSAAA